MASKRMDLNKRCCFILSGVANALGRSMAIELCGRFQLGSVAVLIDDAEEELQAVRKEIEFLENGIEVVCCTIARGGGMDRAFEMYQTTLTKALSHVDVQKHCFERAFILHNEGTAATNKLMEPQDPQTWLSYVDEHLYAAVGLNQAFLKCSHFVGVEKLVVNVTSSLLVKPLLYQTLMGSCKKARDMYFRAMAADEARDSIAVLTYSPGILDTHVPEFDLNNNKVELCDLSNFDGGKDESEGIDDNDDDDKRLRMPRLSPQQSTLKLINILEEMAFISGHDVDYYDTYVL